ncbi:Stf0 family sulfotransferase [Roseibium sp. Sym1]|uniref:Stf0 family sulfotransferase n=1 Tax=Roseibium sp. Sym1 TaxID=3016006 RepID=UPI0022B57FFB|nr:Stf0 family sulfotransferase [Roseibium sp. Sym1]
MPAYQAYILCTSPRSGSTLLCKLLSATGIAGHPDSHFHEASVDAWLDDLGVKAEQAETELQSLQRIFAAANEKGSRQTGMFGLRLQRHSFPFFMEKLKALHPVPTTDTARLEAAFGRTLFIHLTRQDKIGQAVSFVKAQQSGLWHRAPDGTELERLSEPREPHYDGAEIRTCYERFTGFDRDWLAWFGLEGIRPLRITYEDLSAAPRDTLRLVLEKLGLDPVAADGVTPAVAKLADEVSADWAARFRRELESVDGKPA